MWSRRGRAYAQRETGEAAGVYRRAKRRGNDPAARRDVRTAGGGRRSREVPARDPGESGEITDLMPVGPDKSPISPPFGQLPAGRTRARIVAMTRSRTLSAGLGALALAGAALGWGAGAAEARVTVLDADAATIARAIAPRPDGSPGIRLDDTLFQLPSSPSVLGADRQFARVAGSAAGAGAPSLLGLGPQGMADLLAERAEAAGGHRVFVDELGPAFAGPDGADLAEAMQILSGRRPSWAPQGISRRVHFYTSDPAALLAGPSWGDARLAVGRGAGLWLKSPGARGAWTAAEWLAWPAEAQALWRSAGESPARAHVAFGAGDQAAAWSLGRAGSACAVLASGVGGYRLGSSVDSFVAEFRRTLPVTAVSKQPVTGCVDAPGIGLAGARALAGAVRAEDSGLAIPEGGLVTPPLTAGDPAQLTLQLAADPLGLAAGLGVTPEAFWTAAQARVEVRGPGVALDAPVGGDAAARMEFTPTAPGPVRMRLVIEGSALGRALGGEPDIVTWLHAAGAGAAVVRRVVSDPSGWRIAVPLVQPGHAPGTPVLEIIPRP
jgi:hypothetical protein